VKIEVNNSATVVIRSRRIWNETEIEIQKHEEYVFEADGLWRDLTISCDADGYTNSYMMRLFDRFKRSQSGTWFALIGSMDKDNDFLIGKKKWIVFQQSGLLFCYANDVKGFYWNNSGEVSLKITRLR